MGVSGVYWLFEGVKLVLAGFYWGLVGVSGVLMVI